MYECKKCGRKFRSEKGLKIHLAKIHTQKTEIEEYHRIFRLLNRNTNTSHLLFFILKNIVRDRRYRKGYGILKEFAELKEGKLAIPEKYSSYLRDLKRKGFIYTKFGKVRVNFSKLIKIWYSDFYYRYKYDERNKKSLLPKWEEKVFEDYTRLFFEILEKYENDVLSLPVLEFMEIDIDNFQNICEFGETYINKIIEIQMVVADRLSEKDKEFLNLFKKFEELVKIKPEVQKELFDRLSFLVEFIIAVYDMSKSHSGLSKQSEDFGCYHPANYLFRLTGIGSKFYGEMREKLRRFFSKELDKLRADIVRERIIRWYGSERNFILSLEQEIKRKEDEIKHIEKLIKLIREGKYKEAYPLMDRVVRPSYD